MRFRAAILFVAVASLLAGDAYGGDAAVPAALEFAPGSVVTGTLVVASFGPVVFTETLLRGGRLIGLGGPPSDPERWSWSGTWDFAGDRLCRAVPATNSISCLTLRRDAREVTIARPAGKLGDGNTTRVEARLFPGDVALRNWTVPAAVVFALRGRAP